jgi:hypothetical protein
MQTNTYRTIFDKEDEYYTIGYIDTKISEEAKKNITLERYTRMDEVECYDIENFSLIDGKVFTEHTDQNHKNKIYIDTDTRWITVPFGVDIPYKIENYEAVIALKTMNIHLYNLVNDNPLFNDRVMILKTIMEVENNKLVLRPNSWYNIDNTEFNTEGEYLMGIYKLMGGNTYFNFDVPNSISRIEHQLYPTGTYLNKKIMIQSIAELDYNGFYRDYLNREETGTPFDHFGGYADFMKTILILQFIPMDILIMIY